MATKKAPRKAATSGAARSKGTQRPAKKTAKVAARDSKPATSKKGRAPEAARTKKAATKAVNEKSTARATTNSRHESAAGPVTPKRKATWHMRLYVAGDSPRSRLALSNLTNLCEERLKGDYKIEVIDLTKAPHLAKADQILAVPTLVRSIPEPMKRIIGDLSNADRALVALDLDVQAGKIP